MEVHRMPDESTQAFDPDCAFGRVRVHLVETAGLQCVRSLASEEDAGPPPKAAMRPSAEAVSAYYQKHVASDGLRLNEETWLPIAKEHFRSLAPPRELSRTQWRNAAARFPPGRRGRRRD